ncbi:MAG TPA: hypothetical protein PK095_14315 [Myxococcota bacterium]|nr:hypothetical protein [Myxococcota bacterium]
MSRALVFSALVGVLACSDVNPGVPVPADIEVTSSESCLREGCFDNDPCTEDQCLATGQCVFVPNDPENACIEDHHCDLGTECVIGRCEVNECGLRRCSFEEVADCRACGPAFGEACSDRDPCTLNFCDASAGRCDFERLECDARCSTQAAMAAEGAGPLEAGVQRAFIGPVTAFEKTCPTGCRCEVPSYLLAGTPSGLRLLDPTSGVPMTCRLDACGDEPILDCAPFYKSREIVVFGETVDLEPGPPARSGAPLVHIPDALRIHTSCPAVRNIGSFGGSWRATLQRGPSHEGDTLPDLGFGEATMRLIGFAAPTIDGARFEAHDCEACDSLGLFDVTLEIQRENEGYAATFHWSNGKAIGSLRPIEGALVANLETAAGSPFGRLLLAHGP